MITTPLEWLNSTQVNVVDSVGSDNDQNQSQIVQLSDGNVLIAWASNADPASGPGSTTNTDIIGRIYDPLGNPVSAEIQLNTITGGFSTSANFPAIDALPGGGFVVSYRSFDAGITTSDVSIEVDVYNNSGSFQRHIDIIADNNVSSANGLLEQPRVAVASDTSAFVTYGNEGDVKGTVFNPSTGAIVNSDFTIANQSVGDFQGADVVRYGNDLYVVAFADRDPGNDELYYALYSGSGSAVTVSPQLIDSSFPDASDPRIAVLSNGDFVVSWEVDGSGGTNTGVRFAIMENILFGFTTGSVQNPLTTLTGNQPHSNVVALEEGGFVISWYDENTHDLRAQRFDNDGAEVGVEFTMVNFNSFTITNIDMAQLEDGRFQISYTRNTTTNDADVVTEIWDPRDAPNATPLYPDNIVIGTPLGETINPVPAGAELIVGSDGNDTFWLDANSPRIGATYDGGNGTDTVGIVEPGSFNFYSGGTDTVFTDVETFKFNAGGASGLKTAALTFNQALDFNTFDFAQGGASRQDILIIADFNTGNTYDLSGLNIVDFESLHDTIRLRGFGGDDDITGTVSNDEIFGGTGLDTLDGHDGFDTLNTTDSGYVGDVSINLITGAVSSTQGAETADNFENFQGGSANETVIGTDAHANELRGGGGNDVFDGGDFSDRTYGEGGDDTFLIREADDIDDGFEIIDGGTGTDTIAVGGGLTGNQTYDLRQDTIDSIEALDFLGPLAGAATVQTLRLSARNFNDGDVSLTSNIDGFNFAGRQEILEVFLTSNSSLDLSGLTFTNWSTADDLVRINGDSTGETITGTSQNDEINGNSGDDILDGGGGADVLNGGANNDILTIRGSSDTANGGFGDDTIVVEDFHAAGGHIIDGGNDVDTLDFSSFNSDYTIDIGAGTWTQNSSGLSAASTLLNMEHVLAGNGDDTITGTAGFGNTLDGGGGLDTVSYAGATGDLAVYLEFTGLDVGGGQGADTLVDVENLIGGDFDDRLIGDSGNNTLTGGDGHDVIKGKDGNDTFFGGDGNDRITGGSGVDIIHGGAGEDILFALGGNDILNGGDDRDFVYGGRDTDIVHGDGGDDEVRGNLGNDMIFGDAGIDDLRGGGNNDTLDGGADGDFLFGENGLDILIGGAGADSLTGGMGAGTFDGVQDTFVYSDSADGAGGFDRIKDWEDGIDVIDLSYFGFTNFTADVLSLASNSGTNMRINFGSGDVLLVENFDVADFNASDVLLM